MKNILASLCTLALMAGAGRAGEAGAAYIWQVCDGLASDRPQLSRIYCHDHYALSGIPPFDLISAPNIPPTNSPYPLQDHNLLSASGIAVSMASEEPLVISLDASKAAIPARIGRTLPELLKLAEQAIKKTAREWKIKDYKLAIKLPPSKTP